MPVPDCPGHFRVGNLRVDAATRTVVGGFNEEIVFEGGNVVRLDDAGRPLWKTAVGEPLGGVRPPDRLVTGDRVFVAHGKELVALERATGKILWRADEPNDRLHACGHLLLATGRAPWTEKPHERWIVARDTRLGAMVFVEELGDHEDPERIEEVEGLFLLRSAGTGGSAGSTRLFAPDGQLKLSLPERVAALRREGDGWLFLSGERLSQVNARIETLWESWEVRAGETDGAELVALPGGDRLAATWCGIADSGVQVVRFRTGKGDVAWRAKCQELGVSHSKYWHRARLELRGERLFVISQAAGVSFVETLDLATGKQLARWRFEAR
ncbi:MAG: PQQ-binding-like beta-propeller repeat protein [Planctomycetes bacterium]|nr:PQQ-binding-like beta-propeller repeat protein [Planctomycetota bacterium]